MPRSALAGDGLVADVLAVLHAFEADAGERGIGRALRLPDRLAERGDAQYPAAARDRLPIRERGAGMKDLAVFARLVEARDRIALARVLGIARGRDHHAERCATVPFGFDAVERAFERAIDELDQVRLEPHHDRLRLRVAEA